VTSPPSNLSSLLATLRGHGVRFVLVGGVAAVVEGAPLATFDLDIVLGFTKDVAMLPTLRATLAVQRARERRRDNNS
jgi:hypothetical protein